MIQLISNHWFFCVPHEKYHGVIGLRKHYHFWLDPKLGHGKYAILWVPCACIYCTNVLYKTWVVCSDPTRQQIYQPVEDYTYWPVLGSFNNWNIIKFNNKTTTNKYFDAVHKVVLDGLSDNIVAIFQDGKYGAINT